jgi:hypothetical protein
MSCCVAYVTSSWIAFMYGDAHAESVYYCPKCDRSIPKERVEAADAEIRARFGKASLSNLRCPVCDAEYIDLDEVRPGGEEHVGKAGNKVGLR